jgi:regulator of protease activity HflC (stomatin/prohibitin superfamily)
VLLAVASWALVSGGCSLVTVPAGYVGLRVSLYGSSRGVDAQELTTGRYLEGIGEEIYTFPLFEQTYVWSREGDNAARVDESITFQTREGLSVNTDIGANLTIEASKVDQLFQRYRKGIEEIVDGPLRNSIRDYLNQAASTLSVEEVYSTRKVWLIDTVQTQLQREFSPLGINIKKVFLTNTIRLPKEVQEALNAKITATQRAMQRENELRETEARARQRVVEATADAEANRLRQASITPLLIQQQAIEKWDGKLPQMMGTNTQLPFIQLK